MIVSNQVIKKMFNFTFLRFIRFINVLKFISKGIFILILGFIFARINCQKVFAQCGCSAGSPMGISMPLSGTIDVGMVQANYLRGFLNFRHIYGNEYYRHDMPSPKGTVDYYHTRLANLTLNYGLNNQFLIETELAYFIQKYENHTLLEQSTNGFSNINLGGKANLFFDRKENFELTLGGALRIPFRNNSEFEELPMHLRPSSESFGLIFNSFIRKQIQSLDLHLFLINRIEFNFNNRYKFRYGNTYYNSFFALKKIAGQLNGILEIRNEIRQKDREQDEVISDSGGFLFILSPQLSYTFGNFGLSLAFDYPFYKYYYGNDKQLAIKYSILLNLFWGMKI